MIKEQAREDTIRGATPGLGYRTLKRTIDIVFALLGTAITLPFLPLIALAIFIETPGPIFYTQQRVGLNGEIFQMFKFRSMQVGAEELGPQWVAHEDERITRVGRLMRRFHLDESVA
jgi:lipopolysaccharide/colanic/teichoic acid biosynthesis glycosyltransferase